MDFVVRGSRKAKPVKKCPVTSATDSELSASEAENMTELKTSQVVRKIRRYRCGDTLFGGAELSSIGCRGQRTSSFRGGMNDCTEDNTGN